ncbi:unnamed protein product, partial [Ilex paraguariensis]
LAVGCGSTSEREADQMRQEQEVTSGSPKKVVLALNNYGVEQQKWTLKMNMQQRVLMMHKIILCKINSQESE